MEIKFIGEQCTLAKKDEINIDWGNTLNEFEQFFDGMEDKFERIAIEEYSKFGLLVEEGAKALVHHDEGDLEDSISFDRAKRIGDRIILEGGSSSEYAWRRHEEPYRKGSHTKYDDGATFPHYYVDGRGQRTRTKRNWRGFAPGRKYMINAINAVTPDYNLMLDRILKRVMEE